VIKLEYNDGKVYNDFYDKNKEEKQKIAKLFSEDNLYLEKLLLNLWDNNIKTQSCCIGHNEEAHITIKFDDNEDYLNKIFAFFSIVQIKDLEICLNVSRNNATYTFYIPLEYRDFIFEKMNQLINHHENKLSNTMNYLLKLLKIAANNNYCFEAKIINNEVKLELYNETFQDSDTAKLMILIDFIDILENNQKNVELPIITISNLNELNLFIEDKYMSKNSKKIK